ncbi:hypothetical protein [Caenispirillum bisanense]|uniref:WYL domain-containing protein n=1 Tax=Caenispirillum bisanense TaxID=414052 RepID=A0A286GAH3_9PROT|nr:hypothetical protein [Caenispirillum bisanense]SOD92523.1 hypothetical protein SAMN05421508_102477 [Caenispirillum bisanense]
MNWQSACEALNAGKRLRVVYDGETRIIEVHAVGVSTANNECMRVWQVEGGSVSGEEVGWKLMTLSKVTKHQLLEEASQAPRPGYKKGDSHMKEIYCQL